MDMDAFMELDAVVADMDEREDERFKFLGECLAMTIKKLAGG